MSSYCEVQCPVLYHMQQALQFKNKTTSNEVTGFLFKPWSAHLLLNSMSVNCSWLNDLSLFWITLLTLLKSTSLSPPSPEYSCKTKIDYADFFCSNYKKVMRTETYSCKFSLSFLYIVWILISLATCQLCSICSTIRCWIWWTWLTTTLLSFSWSVSPSIKELKSSPKLKQIFSTPQKLCYGKSHFIVPKNTVPPTQSHFL
jgi:hypothetical protein